MDWSVGVFNVMSIMVTIIGIISAIRFVYVDNQYSKIISEQKAFISEQEEHNKDENEDFFTHINSYQRAIGFYKARQNNNKREGVTIDFLCLLSIVLLALFTTQGIFQDVLLLSMILFTLFLMPLAHFLTHIHTLNKKNLI